MPTAKSPHPVKGGGCSICVVAGCLVVLISEVGSCGRRLGFRVDPDTDLFGNGLVCSMTTEKTAPGMSARGYTPAQVAEMLEEPVRIIVIHCRTQVLKGAYKTGGRTSPWRIPPAAIDYYQAHQPRQ